MAASAKLPPLSDAVKNPFHVYHAEAFILRGEIKHPILQPVEPYGIVKLENTRRDTLITQSVGETNIEGLISFKRGHTRVIGTRVREKRDIYGRNHAGWATVSTAEVEGYNVLDVITADRVVAQITTDHAFIRDEETNEDKVDIVPRVNFLGTVFENLRIGGFPVEVELNLALCGPKPEGDRSYLQDERFLDGVHRQLDQVAASRDLPDSLEKKYSAEIAYIDDLKRRAKDGGEKAGADGAANGYPKVRCSLVKAVKLSREVPGVHTFGNLVFIEDYGTVALAEVEVGIHKASHSFARRRDDKEPASISDSNYFTLNMMAIHLGCGSTGVLNGPVANSNGNSGGPGNH
jgi:hypothetical protein